MVLNTEDLCIGREIKTHGSSIVGIVTCVPKNEFVNAENAENFSAKDVSSVIKMTGVEKRRVSSPEITTRDLCSVAAQKLITELDWDPSSIDALIFITQTPDYILPASSCALHADLKLSKSCIAFDINLGCSGYIYGLWLAMTMLETGSAGRVLLAVGDTITKLVDPHDRATAFLFGDAGSVTAIERSSTDHEAHFILGSDGRGVKNLIVPGGGFKKALEKENSDVAIIDSPFLYMDGGEIFNFTLRTIPLLFSRLSTFSASNTDACDAFLFHQANEFMLNHFIKKLNLPKDKVPQNISEYGNTSSASIPLLMTTRMRNALLVRPLKLFMFGFGVGYSWGGACITTDALRHLENIEL